MPLSSMATAILMALIGVGVASALYPPSRRPGTAVIVAAYAFVALKILLSTFLVVPAWRGEYVTAQRTSKMTFLEAKRVWFPWRTHLLPWRHDRVIDFEGDNFGFAFVNDLGPKEKGPNALRDTSMDPRQRTQPVVMKWTGHISLDRDETLLTTLDANGFAAVLVDGKAVFRGLNPRAAAIKAPLSAGQHVLTLTINKPTEVDPLARFIVPWRVTASPADAAALRKSALASRAIGVLAGLLALTVLLAFAQAYASLSDFLLVRLWDHPDRIALIVFVGFFLAQGLSDAIPKRHMTIQQWWGDDMLWYEGASRATLEEGPLMRKATRGEPFFWYPLYHYVLSPAHMLLGDDFANIIIVNYVCMAAIGIFVWLLLRNRLTPGSVTVMMIAALWFTNEYVVRYTYSAYTDNLYIVMALAVVVASVAAFERRSYGLFFLTGVLTALGAATRPSMMLHLPIFFLFVLAYRRLGGLRKRVVAAGVFVGGFFAGCSPFTIRNWIVSHRAVLLVASFVMLPYFLIAPGKPAPNYLLNPDGSDITASQAVLYFFKIWGEQPLSVVWVEVRKIMFTLGFGFASFAPPIKWLPNPKWLFIYPIIFALAVWTRRMSAPVLFGIGAFLTSHMVAMIIGAPWTYGYKSILPFHLVALCGAGFLLPRAGTVAVAALTPRRIVGRARVSVVLPTYNEKDSIRQSILDFFATGVVDEVLVINNNAVEGTSEEVAGTGAREIIERRQGYGSAIQRGLEEANGDFIVVCEPDGTFLANDIHKLLAYASDFDAVYGSRTSQQFIWRGANMGLFLRWGNWAVAKFLQFVYNATSLTDVGCTYRVIRREAAQKLAPEFQIRGSQFGPEMMIRSLRAGLRVIQVPVNYLPRVGESSVTGDPRKALVLGLQMIWLITSLRFAHLFRHPEKNDD